MPEPDDISEYVQEVQRNKYYPSNAYDHAEGLVHSEYDRDEEVLGNFSKIVDKHLQLINIESDMLMGIIQIQAGYLTHMCSMAVRDKAMRMVFRNVFYGWRNGLLLTKSFKGAERKHQAQVSAPGYTPREFLGGYGQQQNQEEEKGGILSNLFGKKRQG